MKSFPAASIAGKIYPLPLCAGIPAKADAESVRLNLQRSFSSLIIANSNRFVDVRTKDLSVADLSGPGGVQDGLLGLFYQGIGEHHLDLGLGNEIDAVLTATVDLGMALLPSVSADLEHRHALDTNFLQRSFYRVQLGILYDCFDLRHDVRKSCSKFSPLTGFGLHSFARPSSWRLPIVPLFSMLREVQALHFFLLGNS
jgi:hypothetical protein